jgi:hypothetical protein
MKFYGFIVPGGSQEPPAIAPGVAVRATMESQMTVKLFPVIEKTSIDVLGLSNRTHKALMKSNILSLADLVNHSEVSLLRISGLGRNCLNELREKLQPHGLRIGMELSYFSGEKGQVKIDIPAALYDKFRVSASSVNRDVNEYIMQELASIVDRKVK